VNPVRNNIRRACHDEFTYIWFAARAAEIGMVGQAFDAGENALRHATRCCGLIPFDVLPDFNEVGDGRFGPNYSHDGAGSSRFLPQERSQRAVFS